MRIIRTYPLRLPKSVSTGDTFDRIVAGLQAASTNVQPRFFFEENPSFSSAPVTRITKAIPAFQPFHITLKRDYGSQPEYWPALSNLGPSWKIPTSSPRTFTSVSNAALSEVAHGIPRRFALWEAHFYFESVPWNSEISPDKISIDRHDEPNSKSPTRGAGPSLLLFDNWSPGRRHRQVSARVEIAAPPLDAQQLPESPEAALNFMARLGKFGRASHKVFPDLAERAQLVANQKEAATIKENFKDRSATFFGLKLPFNLVQPQILDVEAIMNFKLDQSPKSQLLAAMKPLGFRYDSRSAPYSMKKQTPRNNTVVFDVDAGSRYDSYTGLLGVVGPFWNIYISVPITVGGNQFPVYNSTTWEKVFTNAAVVVRHLEETFVPAIDQLMGESPRWFASL